jgi:cytidine deaminase
LDEALLATLTTAAIKASERAYAPYSKFPVGAALLFDDEMVVTGANVENASYGLSCCAERNAIFCAISEHGPGPEPGRKILAVVVYHDGPQACPPCGACLQVISEFAAEPCMIYFSQGKQQRGLTLNDLLPVRFSSGSL